MNVRSAIRSPLTRKVQKRQPDRAPTLTMPDRRRTTQGVGKAYDIEAFVGDPRARRVTPHIAISGAVSRTGEPRGTAIDDRTTATPARRSANIAAS